MPRANKQIFLLIGFFTLLRLIAAPFFGLGVDEAHFSFRPRANSFCSCCFVNDSLPALGGTVICCRDCSRYKQDNLNLALFK